MMEKRGAVSGSDESAKTVGRQSIPLSAISELDAIVTGGSPETESDRAAYSEFFSILAAEGSSLKVYDLNERPAEWTDVEFSDKRFRFNWAFALRTEEFARKNAEAEASYAEKYGTVPEPPVEDSFEDFTIPEPVRSDEDVVRITKEWLAREFPEHAGLEVEYDPRGEAEELGRVLKMAADAMEEARKGAFKKFPIPKKGGKIARKVPETPERKENGSSEVPTGNAPKIRKFKKADAPAGNRG